MSLTPSDFRKCHHNVRHGFGDVVFAANSKHVAKNVISGQPSQSCFIKTLSETRRRSSNRGEYPKRISVSCVWPAHGHSVRLRKLTPNGFAKVSTTGEVT